MRNNEKLQEIFSKALELPLEKINDDLAYTSVPQWDSVSHMALIAALDEGFGLMIETDDVIGMSSFGKAREILAKYGVAFETVTV
ncbi:MAG: acyl carrier protein [Alphaproteobacteria bacterium]|nr:MAG: acyl carrier protein [Alphaproteobacteria bacterium]